MEKQTIKQPQTPEAIKQAEPMTWAHWMLEAHDVEGKQLWTRVTYNHATRGKWEAIILTADGDIKRLERVPNINGKRWIAWTDYARDVMDEGRASA
jgi:hypothetical protein